MIPCHRPYFEASDLLALLRPGPAIRAFESRIADLVGARFGLLFSDGRVAFRAALQSIGIVDSEVILPACICPSMANAVIASGNQPVFADIHPEDFCMNPDSLKDALSCNTRVVVPTHMLGYRADVQSIQSRIGDQGIILVEDFAQYLLPKEGMVHKLLADFGIMSFSRGKPINTISGGMLVTNSAELFEKALAFRKKHVHPPSVRISGKKLTWMLGSYLLQNRLLYGSWQKLSRSAPKATKTLSSHSTDLRSTGFPPIPAEFQSRLGLNQLSKLRKMSEMRAGWALRLGESLKGLPGLRPALMLDGASYVRYPILVANRDNIGFCEAMRRNGVMVGSTWNYCLPFLPAFQKFSNGGDCPGTEKVYREAVELPAFPGLTDVEKSKIISAVKLSIGCKD